MYKRVIITLNIAPSFLRRISWSYRIKLHSEFTFLLNAVKWSVFVLFSGCVFFIHVLVDKQICAQY
jgi:hypothetical protein